MCALKLGPMLGLENESLRRCEWGAVEERDAIKVIGKNFFILFILDLSSSMAPFFVVRFNVSRAFLPSYAP